MIKKTNIVFFLLFICTTSFYAQEYVKKLPNLGISAHYGYIADDNYMYGDLIKSYIKPVELSFFHITKGNKNWHHVYNFPEEGIMIKYAYLQNPEELGSVISIMPYLDFPLIRKEYFKLELRSAIGGAYASKIFNRTENYKNIIFSQHLNYAFNFNLKASYFIRPNLAVNMGPSFFHVSNGESKTPNNGLNLNSFFIGLNYYTKPKNYPSRNFDTIAKRRFHISLYPTIGYREGLKYLGDKYLTSSVTLEVQYEINRKQVIGIGYGFFYDETEKVWSKHNVEPVETTKDAIVGGLHISHEFKLDPLYIVFQMGSYVYNYEIFHDTKYYNRMGLKYYINPHFFVSFTHKSAFFFNGNNIEWGVGFRI